MSSKLPSSLHTLDRRRFLRAGTVTLALPVLEVFSAPPTPTAQVGAKNLVAIGTYLGWHQNAFFPKQAGRDYEMPCREADDLRHRSSSQLRREARDRRDCEGEQ